MRKILSQEEVQKRFKNKNLELVSEYKNSREPVIVKCFCGKEKEIPLVLVTRTKHGIISCGCARHKPSPNWTGYGDISGTYWKNIIRGAKKSKSMWGRHRDIKFQITIEQAWNKYVQQNKKCALTGIDIKFCRSYSNISKNDKDFEQTASLDRIDSSKDYTSNNIQWIHKTINRMKMDLDEHDFIKWCELIVKNKLNLKKM